MTTDLQTELFFLDTTILIDLLLLLLRTILQTSANLVNRQSALYTDLCDLDHRPKMPHTPILDALTDAIANPSRLFSFLSSSRMLTRHAQRRSGRARSVLVPVHTLDSTAK